MDNVKVINSMKYDKAIKDLNAAIEQAKQVLQSDFQNGNGIQVMGSIFDKIKDAADDLGDALKSARDKAIDAFKSISMEDVKKMSGKDILENIKNNIEHVSEDIKEGVKHAQHELAKLDVGTQAFVNNIGEAIVEAYRELTEIIDVDAMVKQVSDRAAKEMSIRGGDQAAFPACIVVVLLALAGVAWIVQKFNPVAATKIIENMMLIAPVACSSYFPQS